MPQLQRRAGQSLLDEHLASQSVPCKGRSRAMSAYHDHATIPFSRDPSRGHVFYRIKIYTQFSDRDTGRYASIRFHQQKGYYFF